VAGGAARRVLDFYTSALVLLRAERSSSLVAPAFDDALFPLLAEEAKQPTESAASYCRQPRPTAEGALSYYQLAVEAGTRYSTTN